jgi:hypothetical protein
MSERCNKALAEIAEAKDDPAAIYAVLLKLEREAAGEATAVRPLGCVCPPGAEQGCFGWQCPRRGPPSGTTYWRPSSCPSP